MLICDVCQTGIPPTKRRKKRCSIKCSDKYFREKYKEKRKVTINNWQQRNLEKRRISSRKQRLKNPEKARKACLNYQKKNLRYYAAYEAKRRAIKMKRCPKWLSKEQKRQMRDFYKNRPVGMEVDHIIPLQGENVSGLHVPWNLQYLTEFENISKHNKFELREEQIEDLKNVS